VLTIRAELPQGQAAIREVNEQAFGQPQEANLVDTLRAHAAVLLSLVAELDGQVVGHILYSPVTLDADGRTLTGAGLGPMAVLPGFQRRGIGSRLVEEGNRQLQASGVPFIVVLGHPHYYPRFGFEPAARHGLRCEWEVPEDVFRVRVYDQRALAGVSGLVKYRPEFSEAA